MQEHEGGDKHNWIVGLLVVVILMVGGLIFWEMRHDKDVKAHYEDDKKALDMHTEELKSQLEKDKADATKHFEEIKDKL